MKRILSSRAVQLFLLATASYWLVGGALTPDDSNLEFLNLARTSIAVAVTVAYSSVCLEAVLVRTPDRVQQLSLGIVVAWTASVAISFWSLIFRYGGRPAWMLDANIYGYFVFLQIVGGLLHITAPGAAGGGIPRKNWIALGASCGAAVFVGLLLFAFEPDARTTVEFLEVYFRSYVDPAGNPQ